MNTAHHYQPTIIESALLFKRLATQFVFFTNELKRSWPEFKNDPIDFTKHSAHRFARLLKTTATRPYALAACASAVVALAFMLTIVWLVNGRPPQVNNAVVGPSLEITLLDVAAPPEIKVKDDNEGAGRLQKSSLGGGGNRDPLPPQHGKLPPPSLIPAAIPITPPLNKQSLPVAGIDIDPTQWQDVKAVVYGDPNSTSRFHLLVQAMVMGLDQAAAPELDRELVPDTVATGAVRRAVTGETKPTKEMKSNREHGCCRNRNLSTRRRLGRTRSPAR